MNHIVGNLEDDEYNGEKNVRKEEGWNVEGRILLLF